MATSTISAKTNAKILQLDGTIENLAAGTGGTIIIDVPNVSSYRIVEVINIYEPTAKNLTPIWLSYYDRNESKIFIKVYNARGNAETITVAVHLLLMS